MLTLTLPTLDHAGRYRAEGRCPLHAHQGFELLAIRRGRCTLDLEGQPPLAAGPGTVVLIPPHCAHVHHDHGEVETIYAVFRLPPRQLPARCRQVVVDVSDPLMGWLDQIVDFYRELHRPDPRAVGGLLLTLIARLDALDPPATVHSKPTALVRAESHLLARVAEPVAMDDLAQVSGVTTGHLRSLFREHHGCPPATWHRRQRLELAKRLLRDPRLSVAQVAQACGWESPTTFGVVFRREFNTTPGMWRIAG